MRVHFRRLVIVTTVTLIIIIIISVYSYGKHHYRWKSPTHMIGKLSFRQMEMPQATWRADSIFWDGNSGVRTLPADSQNAKGINQDLVLRFGQVQPQAQGYSHLTWNNLTAYQSGNVVDKDLLMAELVNYNMNILQSDRIPLNRDVPDSRPKGCDAIVYPENLPTTSVVIPFHNEWPSLIFRTVYSVINRTPKHLLKEIILVDDASDIEILKVRLKRFVEQNFPNDLVKLIRLEQRQGLIQARLEGLRHVTAEVVSFFDSHMEVNKDWLQPLLAEVVKNNRTIAMTQLDYIHRDTFNYNFYEGYRTRYGFRWDMQFFETYFRPDQLMDKKDTDPMPGVLMVGAGFVVNVHYFKHIGAYDSEMTVWGGENIELAWRVWMCGGQLLHIPCSRIGHVERAQPYSFPNGRQRTETYNYKRAVDVWLGDYKKYVYNLFPGMKDLDVGSISERNLIRIRLGCHSFAWFIKNIWPELFSYKEDSEMWGQVRTVKGNYCLDNGNYVFQAPRPLELKMCGNDLLTQGFGIAQDGRLRTTIHCVVAKEEGSDLLLVVENCFLHPPETWTLNEHQQLVHLKTGQCLQMVDYKTLVLQPCAKDEVSQKWLFHSQGLLEQNN